MQEQKNKQMTWRDQLDRVLYYTKRVINPVSQSTGSGMGAVPNGSATTFRVWAPHAEKVFVAGTFNNWSRWRTPLASEGHGYWSAKIPGVRVGDEYKFVIRNHQGTLIRTDPYALDVNKAKSNGVVTAVDFDWSSEETAAYQTPGWHELIIYELHVGTFTNTPEQIIGTFDGVIEKLPYLKELGINAIELMPVKEFPGDYSWGYNPAFPFAVTRTYGGREALKRLVQAAHVQGIAVILDVVYNHFGPQDLSLWQFDGWQENGLGGIYFYNDWRSKTPWADTRPDYGRTEVRRFIRDNVFMWLEEFQIDGLRWDATSYIRNAHGHDGDPGADIAEGWSLMREINEEVNAKLPWKIMIAEDLQGNAAVTQLEGAGFDSQWDPNFVHPIRHAVITPLDEDRDMTAVQEAIAFRYNGEALQRIIYTESHDEVANGKARVPEEITNGEADSYFARKRSTLGAVLVFTSPGIPMIFQGQEFLESGWFDDHVPLDWQKRTQYEGIWQLYHDLIQLRRNLDGQTKGLTGPHVNVFHVDNEMKTLAFHRWQDGGPGDDVIVVANFSHVAQIGCTVGLPHPGIWRVRLNSDDQQYGADYGNHQCPDVVAAVSKTGHDGMPCMGNVTLAPYSFLVLSQD